jgi:hypothetical protein
MLGVETDRLTNTEAISLWSGPAADAGHPRKHARQTATTTNLRINSNALVDASRLPLPFRDTRTAPLGGIRATRSKMISAGLTLKVRAGGCEHFTIVGSYQSKQHIRPLELANRRRTGPWLDARRVLGYQRPVCRRLVHLLTEVRSTNSPLLKLLANLRRADQSVAKQRFPAELQHRSSIQECGSRFERATYRDGSSCA